MNQFRSVNQQPRACASKLPELGCGKTLDLVDHAGLEKLALEANGGPIKRPPDGRIVSNVVFVQCAGQRSTQKGRLLACYQGDPGTPA